MAAQENECPMCAAGNVAKPLFQFGPRDWPEDEKFNDDNAHYQHKCPKCKQTFIGHKRRNGGLCRMCWHARNTELVPEADICLGLVQIGESQPGTKLSFEVTKNRESDLPANHPIQLEKVGFAGDTDSLEPLVLEFKAPDPVPDIPYVPKNQRTYVPTRPGKHKRRTRTR